jgi:NADH-quinone oxidoreductase subunit L
VGIFTLFWSLSAAGAPAVSFRGIAANAHLLAGMTIFGMPVATFVTLCFFVGATGKSAQIPLYVWLPDAMAGPTPVSALIHAATMVTAGVYMIGRLGVLFAMSPLTLAVVATIGCATAFLAATIAITQTDIKRVLAYSTVSQLGYMFVGMGVASFSAGIFHLMTHAFFKALLFLGAGSVIHAMSGEQDMSKMGGLRKHLPVTYRTMFVATLAIAGIPGLSGFFSKDEILWQAFSSPHGSPVLWFACVLTAGMTAFYMFRLLFRTFFGENRADERTRHHLHESPRSMTVPLAILAVLAVVGGYVGVPQVLGRAVGIRDSNVFHHFLAPAFEVPAAPALHAPAAESPAEPAADPGPAHATDPAPAHATDPAPPGGTHPGAPHGAAPGAAHDEAHSAGLELGLMAVSVLVALFGIWLAHLFYVRRPEIPGQMGALFHALYTLSKNKYYVDEIYEAVFVRPLLALTRLCAWFDIHIIDAIVNGVGRVSVLVSFLSGKFDNLVVDGAVNLTGTAIVAGGRSLKTFQTGKIQNYLMVVLLGVLVMILLKAL